MRVLSNWQLSVASLSINENRIKWEVTLPTYILNLYSNVVQQLAGVGGVEWIIIIILFLALIFGSNKLPEVARGIGKAASEFEKAKSQMRREMEMAKIQRIDRVPNSNPNPNPNPNRNPDREKLEDMADILGIDYSNKGDNELRTAIDAEIRKTRK
jgi:sec-independent protein translocase protein TatA